MIGVSGVTHKRLVGMSAVHSQAKALEDSGRAVLGFPLAEPGTRPSVSAE